MSCHKRTIISESESESVYVSVWSLDMVDAKFVPIFAK